MLRIFLTCCLAGMLFLAAESRASSLKEKGGLQNGYVLDADLYGDVWGIAPAAELLPPVSRNTVPFSEIGEHTVRPELAEGSIRRCFDTLSTNERVERHNSVGCTESTWHEPGAGALPDPDFGIFLHVLPALYDVQTSGGVIGQLIQAATDAPAVRPTQRPAGMPAILDDRSIQTTLPVELRWAVTVAELRRILTGSRPPRLVDVRRKEDFAQFWLAGSLNIPLFALNTKGFLKRCPFVLLDEGYDPRGLDAVCDELRLAGFEASFLSGGLNAWKAAGLPLEGDAFAQRRLNRMPPHRFRDVLAGRTHAIVALDDETPLSDFSSAFRVPYTDHPESWLRQFERAVLQWTDWPESFPVVLVSLTGKEYGDLEQTLRASRLTNILLLDGGWQAYQELLDREIVARERGTASTDAPTGCPRCRLSCQ